MVNQDLIRSGLAVFVDINHSLRFHLSLPKIVSATASNNVLMFIPVGDKNFKRSPASFQEVCARLICDFVTKNASK